MKKKQNKLLKAIVPPYTSLLLSGLQRGMSILLQNSSDQANCVDVAMNVTKLKRSDIRKPRPNKHIGSQFDVNEI